MSAEPESGSLLVPLSKSQERRFAAQRGLEPWAPMKLARVWLVEVVTARPGAKDVPAGFEPVWGGAAGVRITAYDRDRLGERCTALDLAGLLVHPGPGEPEGFRPHGPQEASAAGA